MKGRVMFILKQITKRTVLFLLPNAVANVLIKRGRRRNFDQVVNATKSLHMPFWNYGYVPVDENEPTLELEPEDEPFRLNIQLYHHVANQVDLKGLDVLEVGSGRGGGAYYMKHYLNARSVVGMDISGESINVSHRTFHLDDLSFQQGDAETLPYQDDVFDVVVNLESSGNYPDLARFFQEVKRVLKPEGYFLYADFGPNTTLRSKQTHRLGMEEKLQKLNESGLAVAKSVDITAGVLRSLTKRSTTVDEELHKLFGDGTQYQRYATTARLVGTPGYSALRDRNEIYVSVVVQKS